MHEEIRVPCARSGNRPLAYVPTRPVGSALRNSAAVALICAVFLGLLAEAQTITTIAGNGIYGFSGDGGPATSAEIYYPAGMCVDTSGNLFFADYGNNRVRKVSAGGIITTVAGNGAAFSTVIGDGGPATGAFLYKPTAVAADAAGNLYIADSYNSRIRKVSSSGIITTVAGNGTYGFSGDGGPATAAMLNVPAGIAVDSSGSLFIADTNNYRIRKVSANGTISTVAGGGSLYPNGIAATSAALQTPSNLAVDNSGNVFVTGFDARVYKVSANGMISIIAGVAGPYSGFSGDGGPATSAELYSSPGALAVDALGNVFVADSGNNRVRKISVNGIITTVAGGGGAYPGDGGAATAAALSDPDGVAFDASGNLLIADQLNFRIRKVSLSSAATPSITAVVPVYSSVTTIQPGEWASIYGANLAGGTATWKGDFPTSLGGISVTVNGKLAYLWYVSPTQINFQAPNDAATGPASVTVTTSGGTATSTVTLGQFAPSFCLLDGKHVTGIILRSDGSGAYGGGTYDILGPTGSSLGYATVAAKPGDTVELFGVGFGPTNPAVLAGQAFSGAAQTTNLLNLSIGGVNVIPTFAGLSGAGLYQINLVVPASLGSGDLSLVATVGGSKTPANVVISLQSAPGLPLLTSVTVAAQITGGQTGQGSITLSGPAPVGGAIVALAAAPQNLASVPATVTVPAGATSATFTISTVAVTSAQQAAIGAAYNNGTASGVFSIVPAATTPSAFTATIQFQPSGSPSCTQLYLISQLGAGYYQINTSASVLSTGGVASNQGLTLTFNSVAPGATFSCGQILLLSAFSMTLNLAQSPSGGVAASGNLTGSLSVSGSLLGPAVILSGPISGTYGPL